MEITNERYLELFLQDKSQSSKAQYRSSINRLFAFINHYSIEDVNSYQLDNFLQSCKANPLYITSFVRFVFSQSHNAEKQNWDIIKWCVPNDCKEMVKF